MKISYNVTGAERKSLVAAISQELNAPTKYLGAPTFAYEVGGYHIDKNGTVTGEDNSGLVADLCGLHGFKAVSEEYDEMTAETNQASAFEDLNLTEREEIGLGKERHDHSGEDGYAKSETSFTCSDVPESYTYQAELSDPHCPDRMEVFSASTDLEAWRFAMDFCEGDVVLLELRQLDENYDFVRGVDIAELLAENEVYDSFAVELPKNGLTDAQVENIKRLVDSKRTLLRKALGRPIKVKDTGENIQFIYPYSEDTGVGIIYSQLSTAFVKHVKKHSRVTATERYVESEKFALRTFLVRLGMSGAEFGAARKWLSRNLSGNASFPNNASYAAMQASRRNGGQTNEQE